MTILCFPGEDTVLLLFRKKIGRSFQVTWYARLPWLEYSLSKKAAFCFPCRLFASGTTHNVGRGTSDEAFTIKGLSSWKNALAKNKGFPKHEELSGHRDAVSAYRDFLSKKTVDP